MSVRTDVGDFITSELSVGRGSGTPAPDDDLLKKGLVDSLGVMELVGFIEDRYGITVRDEDLTPENFGTLIRIEEYVEGRRNSAP
jgi:acyl carrier protein